MFSPPPLSVIKINIDPILFHLGPISIHWYGLMYVLGILAGLAFCLPYAEKRGINRDTAYAIFWPVLIGSLVGGRLYYVVQSNFGYYLQHPQKILATWEGGMAFYGAVFLGTATAIFMSRRKGVGFGIVLDVAAVFIPIAQAIGRIGNLINGDIVGYPSSLPWATQYTNPNNTFVSSHRIAYDPSAAYELLFTLALFALIWALRFRFRVPGTLFVVWLIAYSIGQFALFFDRANIVVALGLKQAQLTAIAVVVLSIPIWYLWQRYYLSRRPAQADESGGLHSQAPSVSAGA
ncbi:MAG: prolipoprotein diacylglyceryl transferase [Chloroflexota bacterium]